MKSRPISVVLQRCWHYDRLALAESIDLSMGYLGLSRSYHGKKILLKPNLISGSGSALACTHGEFIAGVAVWFLEHGARVVLGDSPAFGSATGVCRQRGITERLQGLDLNIVNFVSPVNMKLASGKTIAIAAEALDCDVFVGLPKIKAHNQMFVTMAVKNIFGIVKGINKGMLHMVHGSSHEQFSAIILDLLSLLPTQLHMADGIEAMQGSGPLDGSLLQLNCLAVAANPVALDTAMLELLALDPEKSPLWCLAASRGLVGSNRNELSYPHLLPSDFSDSRFIAPDCLNGIRFNPLRFLKGLIKKAVLQFAN